MKFEEKWQNTLTVLNGESKSIIKSYDGDLIQKHVRHHFSRINTVRAINYCLSTQYQLSKKFFYNTSMIEEYCFLVHNNNWPYGNMKPYTYALLSDNRAIIERYAFLPVDEHLLYDEPKKGMPKQFNYTLQGLLRDDQDLINRGLSMCETEIDKRIEIRWNRAHIACTESIASGDPNEVKRALLLFEDNRFKSKAIQADLCEHVLSLFPLAYAKIAWLKGIEVEPVTKYMPIELLEIKPLKEYTIPYWFLRDFYREKNVDWRYDPNYPELQNWNSDPENPDRKQ